MNREIKFRAWDSINKEMRYPRKIDFFATGPTSGDFIDKWEEVMQYTGLKDKNGKEIYEGDILFTEFESENGSVDNYSSVEFKDGCFMDGELGLWETFDNSEVAGNIYENPELLTSTP